MEKVKIMFKGKEYFIEDGLKKCSCCKCFINVNGFGARKVVKDTQKILLRSSCKRCDYQSSIKHIDKEHEVNGKIVTYYQKRYIRNKDKIKPIVHDIKKRSVANIDDSYVIAQLSKQLKVSATSLHGRTDLLEIKRTSIITRRLIKQLKQIQ